MKKIATNLLVLLFASLLAFLLGEIVVRLFFADQTVMFPRYHTDYRYGPYTLRGIRPNEQFTHSSVDGQWEFTTNSRGLRSDRDYAYEKPAGVLRILVLGDSHTQGYEVRQSATYAETLGRYLSKRQHKVEVLNAGVSGFGTAEQLAYLENEGLRYQPDVVVVGFFSNDYEDNFKSGLFELGADGVLVAKKTEHIPGVNIQNFIYAIPGIKWLGENSHFYSLLFNTAWVYYKYFHASAGGGAPREVPEYAVPTKLTYSAEEQGLAGALLKRMAQASHARGARLLVADIPTDLDRYASESSMPPEFIQSLESAGLEVVASEPLFAPYIGSVEIHLPHGYHHISEFSHALIGTELGRRIAEGLAPAKKDQGP
ncbi:MAG: GDSL-type esterase/lipase family protein [Pseudomonadota bacterium]